MAKQEADVIKIVTTIVYYVMFVPANIPVNIIAISNAESAAIVTKVCSGWGRLVIRPILK